MKYTLVFQWPDGQEPAVSRADTFKGGELCAVQFGDVFDELREFNDFVDLCVELDDYLPVTLNEALDKIRPDNES